MRQLGKNYLRCGENYPGSALALLINLDKNQQINQETALRDFSKRLKSSGSVGRWVPTSLCIRLQSPGQKQHEQDYDH
jgi:hypothetical protein